DKGLPDVALLDVRLKDGEVFPLADKLVDLGVPIVFHSGHIFEEDVRTRYPGAETCQKPVSAKHLRTTLENAR
ncbi:MAG: response regulator, partial [Roseovarius sp.]